MSDKRMSKSDFVSAVAEKTGLAKKEVSSVLDAINDVVAQELGKDGPGEVVLPGLLKLNVVIKPAVPEHDGVNPFTKLPTVFKAKPARKAVKARVLKGLKDALDGGSAQKDDLVIIEGIGPQIAKAFNKAGIKTFGQLANSNADKLQEILKEAKLSADPATWSEQARLAAAGKMDELKKLQDQLQAGRRA
ncbi:DNA-binding protein HRL53 [Anaerolineae bacterium]|nr:DNA-binding protein HRL53 [Anaerolineae bacterium]